MYLPYRRGYRQYVCIYTVTQIHIHASMFYEKPGISKESHNGEKMKSLNAEVTAFTNGHWRTKTSVMFTESQGQTEKL